MKKQEQHKTTYRKDKNGKGIKIVYDDEIEYVDDNGNKVPLEKEECKDDKKEFTSGTNKYKRKFADQYYNEFEDEYDAHDTYDDVEYESDYDFNEDDFQVASCESCTNFDAENNVCIIYDEVRQVFGDIVDEWILNPEKENYCDFHESTDYIYIEDDELLDEYLDDELEDYDDYDDYDDYGYYESKFAEIETKKKPKGTGAKYKKIMTVKVDPKTKAKKKVIKWKKVGGAKKAADVQRAKHSARTVKKSIKTQKMKKKKAKRTMKLKKQMGI